MVLARREDSEWRWRAGCEGRVALGAQKSAARTTGERMKLHRECAVVKGGRTRRRGVRGDEGSAEDARGATHRVRK